MRFIVTGSRDWDDTATIWDEMASIAAHNPLATLLVGDCRTGADAIALDWWRTFGGEHVVYVASWQTYGRRAGPIRNRNMVKSGADLCLAFIKDGSVGATHTAMLAVKAGIETKVFRTKGEEL